MEDYEINELLDPEELFDSVLEVQDFLEIEATEKDLESFLKVCEDKELYTYCRMIDNKINNKKLKKH